MGSFGSSQSFVIIEEYIFFILTVLRSEYLDISYLLRIIIFGIALVNEDEIIVIYLLRDSRRTYFVDRLVTRIQCLREAVSKVS